MKKSKNYNLIVLLAKETKSLLLWKFLIKKMKIFKTVIIHQYGQFEAVTNDIEKAEENSIKFEKQQVNDDSVLCFKCHKKPRDCYLMTCGHRVYCKECAQLALQNKENCPLCRFPIIQISE